VTLSLQIASPYTSARVLQDLSRHVMPGAIYKNAPEVLIPVRFVWWLEADSNCRPRDYENQHRSYLGPIPSIVWTNTVQSAGLSLACTTVFQRSGTVCPAM